jgi:hypothetical protein
VRIFGLGKEKAGTFDEFRDYVRKEVRRAAPEARLEPNNDGFMFRPTEDEEPVVCNLRNLYAAYAKDPGNRDAIVRNWLDTLVMEVPDQTWGEARMILRPILRDVNYITQAKQALGRGKEPDDLPSAPFVGELHVIVMREIGSSLTGVTKLQLEKWGVGFDEALRQSLSNMGLLSFPLAANALVAGGQAKRKNDQTADEVGLVFEGDHLTATWLTVERFRDHIGLRLRGDYVVAVPNRNRLIAIRADEPGLIASITASNRNYRSQPYPLTGQLFAVAAGTTGGTVSLHNALGGTPNSTLDPSSPFTSRGGISASSKAVPLTESAPTMPAPLSAPTDMPMPTLAPSGGFPFGNFPTATAAPVSPDVPDTPFMAPTTPQAPARKQPLVDLSAWGEDEAEDDAPAKTPWNRSE